MVLLAVAWAPWRRYPADALGILVGLYCALLLGNAVFVTPVYSAESLYQPLMLFGGFAAVAAVDRAAWNRLFRIGVALAALLALLGFVQYFAGTWYVNDIPNRASGAFMTPNTLGTALNMFLAPLAALYLLRGSRFLLLVLLWLFAGLVATESRGAMLALAAGFAYIAIALPRAEIRRALGRAAVLFTGFGATWLAISAARTAATLAQTAVGQGPSVATWLGRATWDRSEIYAATMRFILDHPLAGWGANMFFPLFETVKPDSFRGFDYYYAHCDYLQVWLEFGLAGLLLLIFIVLGSLLVARRSFVRSPQDPLPLACGAALATCFAHAMVDFPLYVPYTLMLTGAFLGVLARHAGTPLVPAAARQALSRIGALLTPPIRGVLAVAALAWLAQPMIAEIAVHRSLALLARGEASDALYWQSVAARFEPRHPAQYWAEAMIWREQLALSPNPLFAAKVEELCLKALEASPYEVASLLGRAQLHRRYPELLKQPASATEILAWTQRAVELRPQNGTVQAEHARALAQAGKTKEARALAQALSGQYPHLESVRRLVREL